MTAGTKFGVGSRVGYYGAVGTVIRHGKDKYGEYTEISISGMVARVCPSSLVALDPSREVIADQAVANLLTNASNQR